MWVLLSDEFDLNLIYSIDPSGAEAERILEDHPDHLHLFCDYQSPRRTAYRLIKRAQDAGVEYFIASEAPQNMSRNKIFQGDKGIVLELGVANFIVTPSSWCQRIYKLLR